MSWKVFEDYIQKPNHGPLAVVIGAGIHRLPTCDSGPKRDAREILASWPGLLRALGKTGDVSTPTTVQWEILALAQDGDEQATKKNENLQRAVQTLIKGAEEVLWHDEGKAGGRSGGVESLDRLVRSRHVADVMVLNVDLAIERLLDAGGDSLSAGNAGALLERHREVSRGVENPLRIWHPHGDRADATRTTFGLGHYAKGTAPLQHAFEDFKKKERQEGFEQSRQRLVAAPGNWFNLFMSRPLVFVGTGLSEAEWDIWYALVMRWRNYAKRKNRKYHPPAWILTIPDNHRHVPDGDDRIRRLEADNWDQAWAFLTQALEANG